MTRELIVPRRSSNIAEWYLFVSVYFDFLLHFFYYFLFFLLSYIYRIRSVRVMVFRKMQFLSILCVFLKKCPHFRTTFFYISPIKNMFTFIFLTTSLFSMYKQLLILKKLHYCEYFSKFRHSF